MAVNKKAEFSSDLVEMSEFARVLSHPARLQILNILAERNSCICGEIVEIVPLAQATVSQHLKELANAGLIKGTIDGTKSCYCIDAEVLQFKIEKLQNWLTHQVQEKCC